MLAGILQSAMASSDTTLGVIVSELNPDSPFGVADFGNLPGVTLERKARAMRELKAWRGIPVIHTDGLSDDIAAKQYPIARLIAEGGLNNAKVGAIGRLRGFLTIYPFDGGGSDSGLFAYARQNYGGSWDLDARIQQQLDFAKKLWKAKFGSEPTYDDMYGPPRDPSIWANSINGSSKDVNDFVGWLRDDAAKSGVTFSNRPLPGKGSSSSNPTPAPTPVASAVPAAAANPVTQPSASAVPVDTSAYENKVIVTAQQKLNGVVVIKKNAVVELMSYDLEGVYANVKAADGQVYAVKIKSISDGMVTKISAKNVSMKLSAKPKKLAYTLNKPVITAAVNVVSSDEGVAYFDGTNIVPVGKGKCTFTITAVYGTASKTITVTIS